MTGVLIANMLAEQSFVLADLDGDGRLSQDELKQMIFTLLVEGGHVTNSERDNALIKDYLDKEVAIALKHDRNWDGLFEFDGAPLDTCPRSVRHLLQHFRRPDAVRQRRARGPGGAAGAARPGTGAQAGAGSGRGGGA
eukprot:3692110-Prymnesium_polylepis.1